MTDIRDTIASILQQEAHGRAAALARGVALAPAVACEGRLASRGAPGARRRSAGLAARLLEPAEGDVLARGAAHHQAADEGARVAPRRPRWIAL